MMLRLLTAVGVSLLCTTAALAEVKTKTVVYEHGGEKLEGFMAWDDATSAQRPGVLVVHEWWGLNDYARGRARQLAKLGYVAFALDMYGQGKVAEHPQDAAAWSGKIRENVDAWVARAGAGLKQLQSHDLVDDKRLAAIGYCFGGATVCQLAYHNAPVQGVVSFHGSLPVPTKEQAEDVQPRILICHGAADAFIPTERIQEFQTTLDAGGADWQMIVYAGARHSFTNPAADQRGIEGLKYDKKADMRSWAHMRLFFAEIFAE